MRYRVGISGSYGELNLGDEAIIEVMLRELRASCDADIVVFSRNPGDTEKRHEVRSASLRDMHKEEAVAELKKLDLFILGGGGILFDGIVDTFLRDVNWAKELGIPVMIYAVSAGPLKKPESKQLVTDTLNKVDKITVREGEGQENSERPRRHSGHRSNCGSRVSSRIERLHRGDAQERRHRSRNHAGLGSLFASQDLPRQT